MTGYCAAEPGYEYMYRATAPDGTVIRETAPRKLTYLATWMPGLAAAVLRRTHPDCVVRRYRRAAGSGADWELTDSAPADAPG